MRLLLIVLGLAPVLLAGDAIFLIGNSLTWDTLPAKLDGDVQWHVDCGKPLPYIFANPAAPCVKSSTIWPRALTTKQFDIVSVQPHYRSTLTQDVAVISAWVGMQTQAVFVIHTGWAWSASAAAEYANTTNKTETLHSPAYFDGLLAALRAAHPDRTFRRSQAMDLLAALQREINAGTAPFKDVSEIYRDKIHMGIQSGRYLMHNAMRQALGQPRSAVGFEKIRPAHKACFDRLLEEATPGTQP